MKLNIPHFLQNIDINEYNNSKLKNNFSFDFLNNNLCGLTCLQMCIKYLKNKYFSLLSIFEKSLKFNVIDVNNGTLHYNLIQFLLCNNIVVFASVKQGTQNTIESKNKSGHLVLITGFDNDILYINDPDNINNYSNLNKKMNINKFFYNFSGNLICISK